MKKLSIKIELKGNQFEIGNAILPSMGGDTTKYEWDFKMGEINNYIKEIESEIYMLGFYAVDFDVYAVHFQVMEIDGGDVHDYVAITDFDFNSTEWILKPSTHENPRKEFAELIVGY